MHDPIRLALIILSVVLVVIGGYHRVKSQRGGESLDRTKEGWPILIGIRLTGLLMVISTVGLFWRPVRFHWAMQPLPDPLRWIGVGLFACSVAWLVWMFRSLGRNLTDTVVTRRNAELVKHGPYRFVRNPMYLGILVAGFSLGIALGTWLLPLEAGLIFALFVLRTRTEEKYLVDRFGDRYREYMEQVGRFFPRFHR